jgi:CheY-like chemotaxis protein
MEQIAKFMEAASTLLWPLIVIVVIVVFRPAVSNLIESARSRRFTVKIGGQELTMDEAGEQQRSLIADLQSQLIDLRKRVDGNRFSSKPSSSAINPVPRGPASILWVDDNPKNNSYFIDQLQELGIKVDLVPTTSKGLEMLARRRYSCVISDMGRKEDGKEKSDAGLDLLRAIRERDPNIPFVIFCSSNGVRRYGADAMLLGATGITASGTELIALLNLEELRATV